MKFNFKKASVTKTDTNLPVKHKNLKRAWFWSKLIGFLILLVFTVYGVWAFFDNYSIRSPFQNPIVPRKHEAIISPLGKGKAKTMIFDLGKIANYIYMKESSSGRNDGCNRLGLFNGYGWRQNDSEWVCFSSRQEVRQLVINWLETHIKNGDIEKALCYYNRGIAEHGCTYSVNYLALQ